MCHYWRVVDEYMAYIVNHKSLFPRKILGKLFSGKIKMREVDQLWYFFFHFKNKSHEMGCLLTMTF